MTEIRLKVDRTIRAAQKDIFNAWLDPELLTQFMLPGENMSVPKVETDPKEGGRFEIVMATSEQDMPHRGTYREIRPHERLVFSWESPFAPDDSLVTLTFKEVADGTHITLEHTRFSDEEMRDNHAEGWTRILSTLDSILTK